MTIDLCGLLGLHVPVLVLGGGSLSTESNMNISSFELVLIWPPERKQITGVSLMLVAEASADDGGFCSMRL